jgi:hypothetical protein
MPTLAVFELYRGTSSKTLQRFFANSFYIIFFIKNVKQTNKSLSGFIISTSLRIKKKYTLVLQHFIGFNESKHVDMITEWHGDHIYTGMWYVLLIPLFISFKEVLGTLIINVFTIIYWSIHVNRVTCKLVENVVYFCRVWINWYKCLF